VNVKDRKEWIDKNGPKYDVIISHPKLVETGLTLFSKQQGGHNFSTLIFYETGYHTFTVRQAARRAWRIGQPYNCKVYYLYYTGGMQHRAMNLIAKKVAASAAIEGEFSTEGLAALAGEDSAQMALARALDEQIDDSDMQRAFGQKIGGKKSAKAAEDALVKLGRELKALESEPDPLADLPDEVRLVAETIADDEDDYSDLPMLTREGLAAMFSKLLETDLSLDYLDDDEAEAA
jgi:hypothetical protein